MSTSPPIPIVTQIADQVSVAQAHAYNTAYANAIKNNPLDQAHAQKVAQEAAARVTVAGVIASVAASSGLSAVASTLAYVLDFVTKAKQGGQPALLDFIAASLSDALLIDISAADIKTGQGAAAQAAVNAGLGKKFIDALKVFFGANGSVTSQSAEAGAASLVGLGMQMSGNAAFLGILGGLLPQVHLDELKEATEMLEKSLGLNRLVRLALTPLIQQTISLPLTRSYAAQYRQAMLGVGELARAQLADRMPGNTAHDLLTQHGLSDDQIAELVEQHTPRLHASEWEELAAITGQQPDKDLLTDAADGASQDLIDARQKVLAWKRLGAIRNRVLGEVLSKINQGFLQPLDLEKYISSLAIPQDEANMWRQAAGAIAEVPRKRLSQGEILFLYEAAQITLEEVQLWLQGEGYSPTDQQQMLTFFQLKAAAASNTKTGGAAAKTAHLHIEHVAYVTDEITGLFGRPPTAAELNYWVALLDTSERTKHDFVTELKGLDPKGSAIPPA